MTKKSFIFSLVSILSSLPSKWLYFFTRAGVPACPRLSARVRNPIGKFFAPASDTFKKISKGGINMKRKNTQTISAVPIILGAALLLLGLCRTASAEIPVGKIPYQARLTDANSNPLTGTYNLTFRICDSAAGDCSAAPGQLWFETQTGVSVDRGLVSVNLGNNTVIPGTIFNGATTYLEIQVEADPAMTPRIRLLPSPYAFNTQSFQGYDFTALVSTFTAQTVAGIKTFSDPIAFMSTASFRDIVAVSSLTVHGTAVSTSGFVGVGSTLTLLNASNLSFGTVPNARIDSSSVAKWNAQGLIENSRIDSSSVAKWNAQGLIENSRLDPGIVMKYTSATFTTPVTFNSTATFNKAVMVSSLTSVGTITSTNGVVGANMVYLISADEVDGSTFTTSTAQNALKSYVLAPNNFNTIIVEAEVAAWNYQDLATAFGVEWTFYEDAIKRKSLLTKVIGTTAGTVANPFSNRVTQTIKTSFAGGQSVNTTLEVRGQMNASNAGNGIMGHSLRVYGVK